MLWNSLEYLRTPQKSNSDGFRLYLQVLRMKSKIAAQFTLYFHDEFFFFSGYLSKFSVGTLSKIILNLNFCCIIKKIVAVPFHIDQ